MKKHVLFWVGVKSNDPLLQEKHGGFKYLDISKKCWKIWCKKNDVIFFEYNNPSEEHTSAHKATCQRWFDVFPLIEEANINYDKIAVIDGSTLVKWDCPNFFNQAKGQVSAFRSIENFRWISQGADGYKEFFNGFEFDLKKYISCEDIQGSVYYAPRALRHCCQRFFVNGKMQVCLIKIKYFGFRHILKVAIHG